jgi:hypothetical protein
MHRNSKYSEVAVCVQADCAIRLEGSSKSERKSSATKTESLTSRLRDALYLTMAAVLLEEQHSGNA